MSQMTGREPGVVGATLASQSLFAGIIADGHHVDWRNIATAARLMPDRLCLVTDAMLTLAGTQNQFDLHGVTIKLKNGRLTDQSERLAGAHVSLVECLRNVLDHANVSVAAALKMLSTNPACALGLDKDLGTVQHGARASLTCLTDDLEVASVFVDGEQFDATIQS
jgi:N-acetylglucosamine-6-phosphate deacetylase